MRVTISIEIRRSEKRERPPERDSHMGASTQVAPRVRGPYGGKPGALGFVATPEAVAAVQAADRRTKGKGHRDG